MTRAIISNHSSAQKQGRGALFPPQGDTPQAAAILSLLLLFTILIAGFVVALGQAETSPGLTDLISRLLH